MQFEELFGITLRKAHLQSQIGVSIEFGDLETSWNFHQPIVEYSVGWIYIYPKVV
jgi:hypothetical protein